MHVMKPHVTEPAMEEEGTACWLSDPRLAEKRLSVPLCRSSFAVRKIVL